MELQCQVQNYDWGKLGSESTVAKLISSGDSTVKIDPSRSYAELWMGTHPNGPSLIIERDILLSEYLKDNHDAVGTVVKKKFGITVPFLLKVLSIRKALSIQAHPEKNSDDIFNFVPNQPRERIEPKIFKRNIEGQTKQSSKDLNKDLKPLWHIAKRRASNAGGSRTKVIKLEIYDAEDIIPEETCKCSANWCAQYVVENSYTSDIYINVESIMAKIHEIMQR